MNLYKTWAAYEPEDEGVFIAYASMHGNTAEAASKMKEILEAKGAAKVAIGDLSRDDMAKCVENALDTVPFYVWHQAMTAAYFYQWLILFTI